MQKINSMSYFMPPIAPVRDKRGRLLTPATLRPYCEISVEQVFMLISANEQLRLLTEQVRTAPDMRVAKATLLPYVTPCGTFSHRNSKCFLAPSGLVVIDVDHLDSYEEAIEMRRILFDDPFLRPVLSFVSPSGKGVKAFIPTGTEKPAESVCKAMQYVRIAYGPETDKTATGNVPTDNGKEKGIDYSGKDLARACFLSHDPGALYREYQEYRDISLL